MTRRVLIAGIGNIFLGDDGFGVETARRLALRSLPEGVEVRDFGIRGMDLAYALLDDYSSVIFVDAARRGEKPGTVSLLELPRAGGRELAIDAHGMDPIKVLTLARALGAPDRSMYIVTCEPELIVDPDEDPEVVAGLSGPVEAALGTAIEMVESLLAEVGLAREMPQPAGGPRD